MFISLFQTVANFGWSSWLFKVVSDLFTALFGGASGGVL